SRRCRLGTIRGSNEPSRSLGTSIVTLPTSVATVLTPYPLRELAPCMHIPAAGVAAIPAHRIMLVIDQMSGHLRVQRRLQNLLRERRQQPVLAGELHPPRLRRSPQLLRKTLHVRLPH